MDRVKVLKLKDEQIQKLQTQCNTVEEAICAKCQNSLEESFYQSESKRKRSDSDNDEQLQQMGQKLQSLEKQLIQYRERISYHQSMDNEHKKNLEQQVDVILKMEEERLILLKEHKQSQVMSEGLQENNAELQNTVDKMRQTFQEVEA